MSRGLLRQVIGRQTEVCSLPATLSEALEASIAVEDAEGRLLLGQPPANDARCECRCITRHRTSDG